MMKFSLFGVFFIAITSYSCHTTKGQAKPVYFSADTKLFTDTIFPVQTVGYAVGLGDIGGGREVELKDGETVNDWINGPTIVRKGSLDEALVYPNEHIHVSGDPENDDFTFSTLNGTLQRNSELQVLKTFRRLERYPVPPRLAEYGLQTILNIEKEIKAAIPKSEAASQHLFDSLLTTYAVSKGFREYTRSYVKHRYDLELLWVYRLYKDTLDAHGLYQEKIKALLPAINSISRKEDFSDNLRDYLNDLVIELFPKNLMWSMPDEKMFQACFDSIQNNFSGIARDYLLSRVLARAYQKGINVPKKYEKQYKQTALVKEYKRIVKDFQKQHKRDELDTATASNLLLAIDGKASHSLEDLLMQHKGKYVLVDCWASWCGPCLKEVPYLKGIMAKYPNDKIAFLNLSFDKSTANWHRAIHRQNMQSFNNYLLLQTSKAALTRTYGIETIPRYLLFDKEGNILRADAPLPSDPELSKLLDSLLMEKPAF